MPTYKPSKIRISLALICVLLLPVALLYTSGNWFWIQGLIFGLWLVALTYTLFLYMYFYDPEPLMERYRKPGTPGENTIGKRSKSSFHWSLRVDKTPFIPWRYLIILRWSSSPGVNLRVHRRPSDVPVPGSPHYRRGEDAD